MHVHGLNLGEEKTSNLFNVTGFNKLEKNYTEGVTTIKIGTIGINAYIL